MKVWGRVWAIAAIFKIFIHVSGAQALLTTSTLPAGIHSPSFRFGVIDNLSERYVQDGALMRLGDVKSVVFDTATLKKMNPEAKKLIEALNSFGDHGLGDQFNLGVLRVQTLPEVQYFAPIFARGMTSTWTLAVGLPVISYKNKISIHHEASNLDYYRRQFSGLSSKLDEALNINLAKATNDLLLGKGYRPLGDRDESFVGDLQIVSLVKLLESSQSALIYQLGVGLPTGPRHNPDDLAAMNIFGRSTVQNLVAYSYRGKSRWTLMPFANYLMHLPDQVVLRVPQDEDDVLPEASSKQKVHRSLGGVLTLGSNAFYEFNDHWILGAAYEYSQKGSDSFRGPAAAARYDLLSKQTGLHAQRVKAELTYSSVKSFFKKAALLPMMLSLEVSDVIAGRNVERQRVQELNVMLFF